VSRARGLLVAALVALAACRPPPDGGGADGLARGAIRFVDATRGSGLDVATTPRPAPRQILETKGGGLALIDLDGDGDHDLFQPGAGTLEAPGEAGPPRVFVNRGGLRFEPAPDAVAPGPRRWGMGVAVGDVEGDGDPDLALACYGPNGLLLNEDGTLVDASARAGVDDDRWGTACAFGDVDADGDLDLYVANYLAFDAQAPPPPARFHGRPVFGGPFGLPAQADLLYENLGDGTFADRSEAWGVRSVAPGYGLAVAILDLDLDGRQEILVGNDSMRNVLWDAEDGPPFSDRAVLSGIAANREGGEQATMGLALADVNGDGRPDVFTTNFVDDTNTLHVALDEHFFDDRTSRYGLGIVSRPYLGWAAGFVDVEHDGDEDLLVVNGHVYPQATARTMGADAAQPPLLFVREGERFRLAAPGEAGPPFAEPHVDRGAVFGDLDRDGDVDAVVAQRDGRLRLLRNDTRGGHWLVVALRDARPGAGTLGLGSRIVVRAGASRWTRWLFSGGGYQSAQPAEVHVGLGEHAGPVAVEVTWPDGRTRRHDGLPVDRRHLLVRRE